MTSNDHDHVLIGPVALPGGAAGRVYFQQYRTNLAPAITVTSFDEEGEFWESYATFSVNLVNDSHRLQPWEFFAKTYGENAPLTECVAATSWFQAAEDAKPVQSGHVVIPIWRIRPADLPEDVRGRIAAMMGWPEAEVEAGRDREPGRPSAG